MVHWPKKWAKPTLAKVKALWEKYWEEVEPSQAPLPFSYDNTFREPKELDAFDWIALSLRLVARPASKDEYKDYNS
jgi:hypothetical protein